MNEIKNQETLLLSTKDIAHKLNTTKDVILAVVKKCLPNKEIKHGKATYFNEMETTVIIDYMKNNISNNRSVELTQQLENTKTDLMIREEFQHQIMQAKALPKQEKLTLALSTFQSLLEDLQKDNEQKQQEINELTDWKTEKLYIENEQYKSKELKTKINRLIRKIAIERFNKDFKATWNYYFNIYCSMHCFKGSQNLEMIKDRGDLKEFYNIILNN